MEDNHETLERVVLTASLISHTGSIEETAAIFGLTEEEMVTKITEHSIDMTHMQELPLRKYNVPVMMEQLGIDEKALYSACLQYFCGHRKKSARVLHIDYFQTLKTKIEDLGIDVDELKKRRIQEAFKRHEHDVPAIFEELYSRCNADVINDMIGYGLSEELYAVKEAITRELRDSYCHFGKTSKKIGISQKYLVQTVDDLEIGEEKLDELRKEKLVILIHEKKGDFKSILKDFKEYGFRLKHLLSDLERLELDEEYSMIKEDVFETLVECYGHQEKTAKTLGIPIVTYWRNRDRLGIDEDAIYKAKGIKIERTLAETDYNLIRTATRLGLSLKILGREIKEYGITEEEIFRKHVIEPNLPNNNHQG